MSKGKLTRRQALWARVPFAGSDIQAALAKLSDEEYEHVDQVMRETRIALKHKYSADNGWGPAMTYELLAALVRFQMRQEDAYGLDDLKPSS